MTVLDDRWATGKHVGSAKPTLQVKIRKGMFVRSYYPWAAPLVDAKIYGESKAKPWMPQWQSRSDWLDIPSVLSCSITQDYANNGIAVATLEIENVAYPQLTGPLGHIYHQIARGALSPYRGMSSAVRDQALEATPGWFNLLASNAQIYISQGYGDAVEPTFTGLIDDCDTTSSPDKITVTARDFGQVLTDEHVFGWNKSKQLPEPVVFESKPAIAGKGVGHGADASSKRTGHPARFVTDADSKTVWVSGDRAGPDWTEWVEIRVPRGDYQSVAIHNHYPGMEVYLGVFARGNAKIDGRSINDGWVFSSELSDPSRGGMVPGANGGWPFVRHWTTMSDKGHTNTLTAKFHLGDDSVFRLGFRNLHKITTGVYRTGVVRFNAIKRPQPTKVTAKTKKRKVVEVGDVSNIVKCALRWAGFTEWNIESVGAAMTGKISFNRADTLMDIIKKVQDATGYVFFMAPPTSIDSMGVPTFVSNTALRTMEDLRVIRDTDLLTGIQAKSTDEPLGSVIRVRGKISKQYGVMLGQQRDLKLLGIYRPPWHTQGRMAGVLKHVIHTYPQARHTDECLLIAQMIALQEALVSAAAECEVPGTPRFMLNEHVAIVDTATGLNTRVYIARRSSTQRTGQQASYKLSIGGALLDTINVQGVVADMRANLAQMGHNPNKLSIGDPFFGEPS